MIFEKETTDTIEKFIKQTLDRETEVSSAMVAAIAELIKVAAILPKKDYRE